jgi:methanogenic corrinoid protein MtbC1
MNDLQQEVHHSVNSQLDLLARSTVDRFYALTFKGLRPNNEILYAKALRDARHHFSNLAASLAADDPVLFLDYIAWAQVLFSGLSFSSEMLPSALNIMSHVLADTLQPDAAAEANGYIEKALERLPAAPEATVSFLSPDAPLHRLAANYLDALLGADRQAANQLILDAVAQGENVRDIYLYVFQRCQHEIGRLWQMNQISVAQEHYCTAATQMIMSQLYPHIFASGKNGCRLVATAIGDELHEIGVRMVADFLEIEGWNTYYLGANTPIESIISTIETLHVDVVALSATMAVHVEQVAETIDRIRKSSGNPSVKILVGGRPFQIAQDLWKRVGADGYAQNAEEAVDVARQFCLGSNEH